MHGSDCLYWHGGPCSCRPPRSCNAQPRLAHEVGGGCSCSGAHAADELLCQSCNRAYDLDTYDPDVHGYHPHFEN